jgi:glycosyltransferase involved in cell wall biosynthesis
MEDMDLSVVVPTLDGRERLRRCLDSVSEHVPGAEVVVVNGPSTDGTTGMVRDREDVDVLVEVAERNLNVARNAGLAAATGDVVAIVAHDLAVEPGWFEAVRSAVEAGADVVTGPTRRTMPVGMTTETEESDVVGGRSVTFFDGGNVALTRAAIEALDGFDEHLETGGARDGSHRIAGLDLTVEWAESMAVTREFETDGGAHERDWSTTYRSFAYRLTKNYGFRPGVLRRLLGRAGSDCVDDARRVFEGDREFSAWVGNLRSSVGGVAAGVRDGLRARYGDRSPRRNPNGLSSRYDRAVAVYDRR